MDRSINQCYIVGDQSWKRH